MSFSILNIVLSCRFTVTYRDKLFTSVKIYRQQVVRPMNMIEITEIQHGTVIQLWSRDVPFGCIWLWGLIVSAVLLSNNFISYIWELGLVRGNMRVMFLVRDNMRAALRFDAGGIVDRNVDGW